MKKRRSSILVITGAAVVLAVACRDTLAPTASPEKNPFASRPQLLPSSSASTRTGSITLTPKGGDFLLGGFLLRVPAGAVCDPSTTQYGPTFWDDQCTPISAPMRLEVQVTEKSGRLWIDFKPNVRFAPSSDPSKWVTLKTWRPGSELSASLSRGQMRQYALLYAPEIGATPLDEGSIDATMITVVQLRDGLIWRRLKHFSGFTISLGRLCDPAVDEACPAQTPVGGDVEVLPTTLGDPVPTPTP